MLEESISLFFERSDFFLELLLQHLEISVISICLSCVIGLIVGIIISEKQVLAKPALSIVNFLYTIPSLALLGLLIPFSGAGQLTAIIALTAYGLLPIVKNTHTGISNIDQGIIEAAVGMGSTRWQMLYKIKLPLAFPVIMSGFRNMVTMTISLTSIAAYIGAGGLGTAIFRGISTNNMAMVLVGSILTAALAIIIDLLLGMVEKRLYRNKSSKHRKRSKISNIAIASVVTVAFVGIIGYAVVSNLESDKTIHVTSMNFTESLIMGEMLEEYISENTDYDVEYESSNSSSTIQPGIQSGDYDIYVEYAGTAWTDVLKYDGVYQNTDEQYEQLQEGYADMGLAIYPRLGFNNTYGLGVRSEIAEEYGLETYSDLAEISSQLTFGSNSGFYERENDGYYNLCEAYDMDFASTKDFEEGLKYDAINAGEVDVIAIYTTDGQLEDSDIVVLEDDKNFFPSYDAVVVARQELYDNDPELEELIMQLQDILTDEEMIDMNSRVDSDGEDPADVAHEFLVEAGLVEE